MSWVSPLILKGSKKFRSFRTICRPQSSKSTYMAHMCGGPKQVWGDQRAGGPENLLALRVEGTRASGWPSNVGDKTIQLQAEFVLETIVCQIDTSQNTHFCHLLHVSKLRAFWGDQTDPKSAWRRPNSILRIGIETALFQDVFQFKKNYLVRVFGANSNAALISLVLWVLNNWEFVLRDWGWGRLFHKARLEGLLGSWVVQIPTFLHVFKMVEATFRGYSPSLSSKILPLLLLNTSSMEIVLFTDQAWFQMQFPLRLGV